MNTKSKSKKGIIGITLAAIMIASVFAAMPVIPVVSATELQQGKSGPLVVPPTVGYLINFSVNVTNPEPDDWVGKVYDIPPGVPPYPSSGPSDWVLLTPLGVTLTEDEKGTWYYEHTLTASDIVNGSVLNRMRAEGKHDGLWTNGTGEHETTFSSNPPEFGFTFDHACCLNMSFVGTATDPDGNVVNWSWDFGPDAVENPCTDDGVRYCNDTSDDPDSPWCVFNSCGTKTVKLSGYDNQGLYNETEKDVYVPCAPTAVATVVPSIVYSGDGTTVTFNGGSSYVDPLAPLAYGLTIVTYRWDFWDGTSVNNNAVATKVVDGNPGDSRWGNLTVWDGHCNASVNKTVEIREKTNCTLRVYGRLDYGAGDWAAYYPGEPLAENPPYTDPVAPFYPQASQAPRKDFITFDPVYMHHNDRDFPYYATHIKAGALDASEKIFQRMWYEPTEWFKDEGNYGELDLVMMRGTARTCWVTKSSLHDYLSTGWRIQPSNEDDQCGDIYAPAIKQEFTYMILDSSPTHPRPIAAPVGDAVESRMMIPMATWESSATGSVNGDNGIDSFTAFGQDGIGPMPWEPNYVILSSEATVETDTKTDLNNNGVEDGVDLDGDGTIEQLDEDTTQLNGNETLVLALPSTTLQLNAADTPDTVQIFDTKFVLKRVFGEPSPRAVFRVYYQGETSPPGRLVTREVGIAPGETKYFFLGRENTRGTPQGPVFIHVTNADGTTKEAHVVVGRVFGSTFANVGWGGLLENKNTNSAYWNQKHFYVDSVLYNVVAIKTLGNDGFKYITFRVKLPKLGVKIPQHTQHLKAWGVNDILPQMPQYNMNHKIIIDVQETWTYPVKKIGPMPDDILDPMLVKYVEEEVEQRFYGELREIYNETMGDDSERWVVEEFWTLPWAYTSFALPPAQNLGPMGEWRAPRYLLTSAFWANESYGALWDGDPDNPTLIDEWFGQRLKFWYEDCTGPLFVDDDGSLRIYGYINKGPGDYTTKDPRTGIEPENPPYTDPIAPFYPQASQAPEKDFVTVNPVIMYHNDLDWDNDGVDDYVYATSIKNDYYDASEKIFKRMWYEPAEIYKDEYTAFPDVGTPGRDIYLSDGRCVPEEYFDDPAHVRSLILSGVTPAAHDGFSGPYCDIQAPSIKQEFTYMMLDSSPSLPKPKAAPTGGGSSMLIPMASRVSGNGIDSFDADGDGYPDRVVIDSEYSLERSVGIDLDGDGNLNGIDIDNDGAVEPLDPDDIELNGNESLILRLDSITLDPGDEIQFFEHRVKLERVYGSSAYFTITDQEETTDIVTTDVEVPAGDKIAFFYRGSKQPATASPRGPFFIIITNYDSDPGNEAVTVIVGRVFGETKANIGANPWWNQKQFYVDGVCYNVVAIKVDDHEYLKYLTFRVKMPKVLVKIPQHTQELKAWEAGMILPEMPQYNMNHTLYLDVQSDWSHGVKLGPKKDAPELKIWWVTETDEPRFHGELKEIFNETGPTEHWTTEWFQTIPYNYTGFMLPTDQGLYLVTSAFYAPEAVYHIWDGIPGEEHLVDHGTGARVKWWFDPTIDIDHFDPKDLYVNPPPVPIDWSAYLAIEKWYDRPVNGGDGDGDVCSDSAEFENALVDYIFAGTGRYPFGHGGLFDINDLLDLWVKYSVICTQP